MAKYQSTKTWGNEQGFSCCFRQWRATHSHCSLLHGYAIGIRLVFESDTLDEKNWVMDFGGLRAFKTWAAWMFDHTLIIAADDPHLETFRTLTQTDNGALGDLRIVSGVGCEKFAELAAQEMNKILAAFQNNNSYVVNGETFAARYPMNNNVRLVSAEVFEHAGNSAIYYV